MNNILIGGGRRGCPFFHALEALPASFLRQLPASYKIVFLSPFQDNVPFFSLTTTCCALKPLMVRGGPEKREILKNVEKTQKSA